MLLSVVALVVAAWLEAAKMSKLSLGPVVKTVTSFIALVYVLCAFFVFAAPQAAVRFFSLWFHGLDLTKIAITTTPSIFSLFFGFLSSILTAAILTAVFVQLWNRFQEAQQ